MDKRLRGYRLYDGGCIAPKEVLYWDAPFALGYTLQNKSSENRLAYLIFIKYKKLKKRKS